MQLVATELRPGNIIVYNGQLHRVLTVTHVTPGNWRGMVQCKLRNLKTGNQLEHRFRSEDRVEKASLDTHEMQYLYSDPSGHHFMNTETFEQLALTDEVLGDSLGYLLPDTVITVDFYENQPVAVELPNTVDAPGRRDRPADEGRHRRRRLQAGQARDRHHRGGAAVHRDRHQDRRRHPHRRVRLPGLSPNS